MQEHGLVGMDFMKRIVDFYKDYENGKMDFRTYEIFLMKTMSVLDTSRLTSLRRAFLGRLSLRLRSYVIHWLNWHSTQGHQVLMITATNAFLARPVAALLGIQHLICTEVELQDERPTGRVLGTIPYREGKVELLETWLSHWDQSLQESWGYSDSYGDLPLLQCVRHPVAVTPDAGLYRHALEHGWDILT